MPSIETQNLTKVFGRGAKAVDDLSLSIGTGEVYALLGRNGAGKTTTLRLLMGLLSPTGGEAKVLGFHTATASPEQRQRVVYVSQAQQLYPSLTLSDHAAYLTRFYAAFDRAYLAERAGHFALPVDQRIGDLSGGQQRLAAVLLALAARSEVLLLDEPAAGLDPLVRHKLVSELIDILAGRPETTILFSTHIVSDIERLAQRVGFMDRGRIRHEADVETVQAKVRRVQIIADDPGSLKELVLPNVISQQVEGSVLRAVCRFDDLSQIDGLRESGLRVDVSPVGLEELFVNLFDQVSVEDM